MPGYGIAGPDEGAGLLPWAWATERLGDSHDFWIATVWPDGRPHVMPVWGVWAEESLWFSSSGESRKTRNLAHDPRAVATTDDALNPVVVEGTVQRVVASAHVERFTRLVNDKYGTDYRVDFFAGNACFRLRPTWVFGLESGDFAGTPTRWDFP
jgi:hypothetical protein